MFNGIHTSSNGCLSIVMLVFEQSSGVYLDLFRQTGTHDPQGSFFSAGIVEPRAVKYLGSFLKGEQVPGQIIATSHGSLTPNGGLVREMGPRKFQGNLGW